MKSPQDVQDLLDCAEILEQEIKNLRQKACDQAAKKRDMLKRITDEEMTEYKDWVKLMQEYK